MKQMYLAPLAGLIEYDELKGDLQKAKGPLQAGGCLESQKAHLAAALMTQCGASCHLFVTYSDRRAKEINEDLSLFMPEVLLYPAKDMLFYAADVRGSAIARERLSVVRRLAEQSAGQGEESFAVVTTVDALMDHLRPLADMHADCLTFEIGTELSPQEVSRQLIRLGYEREAQVEMPGQFAWRGGILDLYPLTDELPVRVELFGDEVDSIRSFDPESQRSLENLQEVRIYPATDGVRTLEGTVSFLDYFPKNTDLYLDEPARLAEKARLTEEEFRESMTNRLERGITMGLGPSGEDPDGDEVMDLFSAALTFERLERGQTVCLTTLDETVREVKVARQFSFMVRGTQSYQNNFEMLLKDLASWKADGSRVILLCASRARAERLAGDLRDYDLRAYYRDGEALSRPVGSGEICVTYGSLHHGFCYPLIKFAVITESEMFGRTQPKKRKKPRYEGQGISSFSELSVGDYVVHENHGVGIYRGIEQVEVDQVVKDYIKIEYGDGGNLYLPVTQLSLVQKYSGSEGHTPRLNRLGGDQWKKTKSRVRTAVRDMAADLVKLYAARQRAKGYQYGPDTVWQKEFEEMFPYEETEDQLAAIEAVKADMESTRIMDRLICGDVGYGKTEVALRAAFKAVQEGKQVVYLVPTTILAQQHYNTFTQRMGGYAVRVELLSRYRTGAEQKKVLEGLRKGLVDVVIGTHRVLSKDLVFKDLGLLIIDEEQRFGVAHKEKIKELKQNVDVLTLTATPIPRTLHMSLIGIRDMSVLEEPPIDRVPIQTYVMEYDEELVREAIEREMARGGQVYYVFNRVEGIMEVANRVAALVPDAVVAYAHGKMAARDMERIMTDFVNGDIDVLVSTTIIETGLDIPNVNTMIVHDADRYGLSQLYQLRGRVGRSNRTAYAFLMYPRGKILKEEAEKRLAAIREFTELGSGIRIAMRDLELRGAGNLLGAEQHGHMDAVGYDLFCKMLSEAVRVEKQELPEQDDFETTVEFDMDAYLPDAYIPNESQKLDIYRRIAAIENEEDVSDMRDELLDRFGDLPAAVENLLTVSLLRAKAHEAFLTELSGNRLQVKAVLYAHAPVNAGRSPDLVRRYGGSLKVTAGRTPTLTLTPRGTPAFTQQGLFEAVKKLINQIKNLCD